MWNSKALSYEFRPVVHQPDSKMHLPKLHQTFPALFPKVHHRQCGDQIQEPHTDSGYVHYCSFHSPFLVAHPASNSQDLKNSVRQTCRLSYWLNYSKWQNFRCSNTGWMWVWISFKPPDLSRRISYTNTSATFESALGQGKNQIPTWDCSDIHIGQREGRPPTTCGGHLPGAQYSTCFCPLLWIAK